MSRPLPSIRRAVTAALAIAAVGALAGADLPSGPPVGPRPTSGPATSVAGDPVIGRIRDEGLNHSQVMDTLDYLCNVIGARLTGSPAQARASAWTRDQFTKWGLSNSHLEPWGPFGRGWQLQGYALQVSAPTPFILHGEPKAWSPGLDHPIDADLVYLDAKTRAGLQPYKGKLKGKIVLVGAVHTTPAHFEPVGSRMDDDRLAKMAASRPTTGQASATDLLQARTQLSSAAVPPAVLPGIRPAGSQPPTAAANFAANAVAFAQQEGAALILDASVRGDGGTVFVAQATVPSSGDATTRPGPPGPSTRPRAWSPNAPAMPPQVTLTDEDFNRLVSMVKHGEPVRVAADLRVKFTPADQVVTCNTVAEIPGTDLKDQIVMVGGHLDSWQSGTGATDNGAGSACAMEAVRILRALDLHPRRTIRVALWTGEEEGLLGSAAYVKQHFGTLPEDPAGSGPASRPVASADFSNPAGPDGGTNNPATRPAAGPTTRRFRRPRGRRPASMPTIEVLKQPEYEKLSVYFNLDNGTGKIRGIYAQGNAAAVPIFHRWLAPFGDLSGNTITIANTGSTDHISFDRIGLPGFQFIQDPIEYFPRTHHSNADVFDRIQPDDVKEASTIMAALIWDAANADDRFPRKPVTAADR
jgi:hypothetical protein